VAGAADFLARAEGRHRHDVFHDEYYYLLL